MARLQVPHASTPVIDKLTGRFTREWFRFFSDLSRRVAANVPDLAGAATLAQTITAFNLLKDELIASDQMEPD